MSAFAGELTVAGSSQVGGGYTDNLMLSLPSLPDKPIISVWNTLIDVGAHFKYKAETFSASFDPRVAISKYRNRKQDDHTDKFLILKLNDSHEWFDQNLTVTRTEDTTLTSEPTNTATGIFAKHRVGSASYELLRNFNESVGASVQLYGTDNKYFNAPGLLSYQYGYGALTMNYQYDYRTRFYLQGLTGKFLVPGQPLYQKKNISASIGLNRQLSEKWRLSFSYGPSQIRTSQSTDRGTSYSMGIIYSAELSTLSLGVSKDILPNGYGELSRKNQISLDYSAPITEELSLKVSAIDVTNKNLKIDTDKALTSLKYNEVNAGLKWAFTQTWGLSLSAGHAWQDYGSGLAKKNFAALSLTWNGLDHLLN